VLGYCYLISGPDRLEDVGPFLFNLFSDPEIIRIPFFLQTPSVVHFHANQDLKRTTGKLGRLSTAANHRSASSRPPGAGQEARIYVGMRYWHPFTEEGSPELNVTALNAW